MIPLTSIDQLKVGTKLNIIGHHHSDNYGSVSVKKIIHCSVLSQGEHRWTEILINRSKNYFFHLENYLAGKSHWVKHVWVLEGVDKRLKGARNG